MAQVWTTKQQNWLQRFDNVIIGLLANIDALDELCAEYVQNTYGTGGANAIIDSTVQQAAPGLWVGLPAATALQVAEAVGIVNAASTGLLAQIGTAGTNRGYLENMRQ